MSITKRKLSGYPILRPQNKELDDGYLWADKEKMKELRYQSPPQMDRRDFPSLTVTKSNATGFSSRDLDR